MLNEALAGKRILILGVANERSIAWGIAKALKACGARLAFTYLGDRMKDGVNKLSESIGGDWTYPCDVGSDSEIDALFSAVDERWEGVDGIVHSVAFAKREDLADDYVSTSRDGFAMAHDISAYSLTRLCQAGATRMEPGGAVVALSYLGGERVVPGYNVMGVAKASLEMSVRYLANDLGPKGIRVNTISAGPVKTLAARGVKDFTTMLSHVEERTPLRANCSLEQIGSTAAFLLSSLSGAVTGETIHVDGGYHILGM